MHALRAPWSPASPCTLLSPDGELSLGGVSGWQESAAARPDWLLMDLARALHPDAFGTGDGDAANKGPAGTVSMGCPFQGGKSAG